MIRTVQAAIASTEVVAITAIDLAAPWMEYEDGDDRGTPDGRMQAQGGRSQAEVELAEEQKRRDY